MPRTTPLTLDGGALDRRRRRTRTTALVVAAAMVATFVVPFVASL